MISNIKTVVSNLQKQLKDDTSIATLVGSRVYISEDILKYIGEQKLPIINIEFDSLNVVEADNMNLNDFERHTYNINIQFAVADKDRSLCITGANKLLDMYEMIYNAVKKDPTLGGAVDSFIKSPSLLTDVFPPLRENLLFVAGGEMSFTFSEDVFIK